MLPAVRPAPIRDAIRKGGPGRRTRRGFTLIEVLAVAAIMAILATVAIANLHEARIQANEVAAVGALNQLQNAYEQYWVTSGKQYPQYLSTGQTNGDTIKYANPNQLFQDLVTRGLLPQRSSGIPYNTRDLLTPGYQLVIFPYDRSGIDISHEDPSLNYALALQPYQDSKQPNTLAILNGTSETDEWHGRFYKLPDRGLDLSTASLYALANRGN